MIALLKVYETLYQNDEHEILFVMIIKSKFSDHSFKTVLLPYLNDFPKPRPNQEMSELSHL